MCNNDSSHRASETKVRSFLKRMRELYKGSGYLQRTHIGTPGGEAVTVAETVDEVLPGPPFQAGAAKHPPSCSCIAIRGSL